MHAVEGVKLRLHLSGAGGGGTVTAEERTGGLQEGCDPVMCRWTGVESRGALVVQGKEGVPACALYPPHALLMAPAQPCHPVCLLHPAWLPQGKACTLPRWQRGATWRR